MKRNPLLFLVLLSIFITRQSKGQTDSLRVAGSQAIGLSLHSGFIIAHRPALVHLQKRHITMLELSYLHSTDGSKHWHGIYNFPLYGLGYRYIDFGNSRELGKGHSLYSQLLFPLFRKLGMKINWRFGVGIGYIEKPFDTENNYKNLAIGSKLNGTVLTGVQFRFFTRKKLQLHGGIDFFHFSNGAFKLPNLGLNLPTVNIGLSYFQGKAMAKSYPPTNKEDRKQELSAAVAIGFKERYPPAGKQYMINVINLQYHFPAGQKGLLGTGTEMIVDESLKDRLEADSIYAGYMRSSTRVGIFGSCGLRLGKWDALLQPGVYLYSKLTEDGSIYNRLLLKYHFHPRFHAGIGLKSHFAKADYFEWAIGYQIK